MALLPCSRPPSADFFGFFGALKRGDFFGVHPKKVRSAPMTCAKEGRLFLGAPQKKPASTKFSLNRQKSPKEIFVDRDKDGTIQLVESKRQTGTGGLLSLRLSPLNFLA
jgi:hypothetical protein